MASHTTVRTIPTRRVLCALAMVALVSVALVPSRARAAVVDLNLEQLTAQADAVVLAKVITRSPVRPPVRGVPEARRPIFTDYDLVVTKVLKGSRSKTLTLHQPGGRIGGVELVVTEVPQFVTGETCYLFLDEQERIIGGWQGKVPSTGPLKDAKVESRVTGKPVPDSVYAQAFAEYWSPAQSVLPMAGSVATITPTRANAGVGEQVTITGSGFGAAQGTVEFPYVSGILRQATVVGWSNTSVTVIVPGRPSPVINTTSSSGQVKVTNSDGTSAYSPSYNVGYSYSGSHWATPAIPVGYRWMKNSADPGDLDSALNAALNTWNRNGPYRRSNFVMANLGSATTTTSVTPGNDGVNEIYFSNALAASVLAQNYYWVGAHIADSNIMINDSFNWVNGASSGNYDLETVLLHETGHTVCLDDQYGTGDASKMMYGYLSANSVKNTLSSWDDAGVREGVRQGLGRRPVRRPSRRRRIPTRRPPIRRRRPPSSRRPPTLTACTATRGRSTRTADTTPDTTIDTATGVVSTTLGGNGVWYFHVRAVDAFGNWGATLHRPVRVSAANTPPVASADATTALEDTRQGDRRAGERH